MMCKYALGTDNERLCKELLIPLTSEDNLVSKSINEKKAAHVDKTAKLSLIPQQLLALVGTPPYLMMPAIVKGKVIGVFYG